VDTGELAGLALGATELLLSGTDPAVGEGPGLAAGEASAATAGVAFAATAGVAFAATAGVAPGVGEAVAVTGNVPTFTLSPSVLGELPLCA
jgi:hypothetical protein